MSNYITIAEYARQQGVSVQAIYGQLKGKLKPYLKVVDGKKMIDVSMLNADDEPDTIKPSFKSDCKDDLIELYERLLADKDKQIEQLNNHINELTKLLNQQQQLQAQQTQLLLKADAVEQEQEQEPKEPIPDEPPTFKRLLNSVFKRKARGGKVSKQAEQ